MTLKIGDRVSVINEPIEGIVVEIKKNEVVLETKDGFRLTYSKKELVVYKAELELDKLLDINDKTTRKTTHFPNQKKQKFQSEVDLHYEGKSLSQPILEFQLNKFKTNLNLAIKANQTEITFIHGVGEGKLRKEIEKILKKHKISFSDGPYAKYGTNGATVVLLHGLKNPIG